MEIRVEPHHIRVDGDTIPTSENTALISSSATKLKNWQSLLLNILGGVCMSVCFIMLSFIILISIGTVIALAKQKLTSDAGQNMITVTMYGCIGLFWSFLVLFIISTGIMLGYIIYRLIIRCWTFRWAWCCELENN